MWNEDYRDILQSLSSQCVDFILVGAYALASHGYPRATMDIDIWVRAAPDNAERVCRALSEFGAPMDAVSISDFSEEGVIFQIGVAPRRIDIITRISGVDYLEASKTANSVEIDGLTIKILSAEHLIRNKLATGRPRDIDDAENLRRLLINPEIENQ
ncbi:MAG: nucleotidyltransferase [Gammaproteobacteria bacterium]|nr:nucleotidyltransferase [Gammaproteobacteria bacterium]